MSFLSNYFKDYWSNLFPKKDTDSRSAYDLWSESYDNQPGNLMLDLDELVFTELLAGIHITGKQVADIGCGTGRHWSKILAQHPARMSGYDVSEEMLKKLKQKFPGAETHLMGKDNKLHLPSNSCDLVFSTLTVAHIPDFRGALEEWVSVVNDNGDLIFTDYHSTILDRGGKRTFHHNGKLISVENYIYPIDMVRNFATKLLQLKEIRYIEKTVDESVRHYYEKQGALDVYKKFKGLPVIYGIHFKKER